jgi:lysophospholipid acyltransferase (LPLAT)-like uncharacterized protein
MKALRRKFARFLSGTPLSYLLYFLIRLIHATMRITVVGGDIIPSYVNRGEGFVCIFWHGRMLLVPVLYSGRWMHVLISVHRDGEIIANVMKCFGFHLVRGSSNKGGAAALREMLTLLKEEKAVAITPDGPKGPAELLKPGTAQVGKLSGKAIIPVTFSANPCFRARSWDRFMVPYPFSRGVLHIGEPLRYREGEGLEAFRQRLEQALREINARADRLVGLP